MSFSLGIASANYAYNTSDRRQAPEPQNVGFRAVVQRETDYLIGQVSRATTEAVNANGFICHVWNRLPRGSQICSCNAGNPKNVGNIVPENPNLSPNLAAQIIPKQVNNSPSAASYKGLTLKLRSQVNTNLKAHEDVPSPSIQPVNPPGLEMDASQRTDLSVQEIVPPDPSRLNIQDLADLIGLGSLSGEFYPCGICYGTGFIDSFQLAQGTRIVLDAREAWPSSQLSVTGADCNQNNRPNSFQFNSVNSNVAWTLELPLFINVLRVRVWDNTTVAKGMIAEISNSSGNWVPLTADSLLANQQTSVTIRVRPLTTNLENVLTFTHVEILVDQAHEPLRVQIPQLAHNFAPGSIKAPLRTEFELAPNLHSLHRESLIELPDRGLLWWIDSVILKQNNKGLIFGIVGQIRLVQGTERFNQLRLGIERDNATYGFRGLERVQGGLQAGQPTPHNSGDHSDQFATAVEDTFNSSLSRAALDALYAGDE